MAKGSSCAVNSGVVLARGDAHARQMLEFWASAGRGSCPTATQYAEQARADPSPQGSR